MKIRSTGCDFCERNDRKNRLTYILLGIFLGYIGVHNFYAGYVGRGVAQLLISVVSLGLLTPLVFLWNIVEICIVEKDSAGRFMKN